MHKEDFARLKAELSGAIAVIPSLNPGHKLIQIIDGLLEAGFDEVLVVNDGSRAESLRFFPSESGEKRPVTLLTHEFNRGKGRALKTAFDFIIHNRPGCRVVVTVDGDGQHTPADSVLVAVCALQNGGVALGIRDFDLPHVPGRSRMGNKFTRSVFRVLFGLRVSDTQTGLRAFHISMLPKLVLIEGERFEYETNVLLELSRSGTCFNEVRIETLYNNDGETSHFKTFSDSMRIFSIAVKALIRRKHTPAPDSAEAGNKRDV